MGKVVILGGNARSGKSTLAYKLIKCGFNRISFDDLYDSIEEGLNIRVDELSKDVQNKFFESIVNKAIDDANNNDVNIVIDMFDFLPEDINKLENKKKFEVYFLAYPGLGIDEIKYNVIHYAKSTDWIANVDDDYLDSCVKAFYERNEVLAEQCKKYNMELIDTSAGKKRDKVLDELLARIVNN